MALTKSNVQLLASTGNAAGATTNGAWIDVSAAYDALATFTATNGATGPTIGATIKLQRSDDGSGTNIKTFAAITHDVTNSATADYAVPIPPSVQFVRLVVTGNTGQTVTVDARLDKTTAL
jgi:hypothetical protein